MISTSLAASIAQTKDQLFENEIMGICYSGFRKGQHPDRGDGAKNPSEAETLEDLEILSKNGNFKLIRLYDSQSNSKMVLEVIRKHQIDLKVLLGAWLDAEVNNPNCPWITEPYTDEKLATNKASNAEEIQRAIDLASEYEDIVIAVAVGNEALVDWNDHMVTEEAIINYVREVKGSINQPVTVADNFLWWAKHGKALAAEVDFASIHIYPQWEGKPIEEAIPYGIENMQQVRDALPDTQLVITEAGWATTASEFGARASEALQEIYYRELTTWLESVNITCFFFEAFDESWKGNPDNPIGAEKHWGIFFEDRTAKKVMHDLYPERNPEK